MQSITTTDMANSVITLLRGAGLLNNLTEIAEKRRIEDEHVLTDKLEMVKGSTTISYAHYFLCTYQC